MNKEQTYAAQMELTNVPEDSLKQWTNMPPLSDELYNEFDLFEDIKYTLDEDFLDEMLLTIKENRRG